MRKNAFFLTLGLGLHGMTGNLREWVEDCCGAPLSASS